MSKALRLSSDNLLSLNLTDQDGNAITGATVTAYLQNGDGTTAYTISLTDEGAGLYDGVLPYTEALTDCTAYRVKIVATKDSNQWSYFDTVRIIDSVDSSCRLVDWTSDYLAKGNYTEADAPRITARIEAATKAIQRYCHRDFFATTYDEKPNITQFNQAILKQFPIKWVRRVCDRVASFFTLTNTDATVTNATFYTDSDGITLTHVIGGAVTVTTIAWESDDEGGVSDTINAIGHGWNCTDNMTYEAYSAADVITGQFGNCANSKVATITGWLDTESRVHVNDKTGILTFAAPRWGQLFVDPLIDPFFTLGGYGCNVLRVVYSAGYDAWDIPADLQQACADIVMGMDNDNKVLASESLGNYSYSVASAADALARLPTTTRRILQSYRTYSFAGAVQ